MNTNNNIVDEYCRKNREKSISPSIDSSFHSNLSEKERDEINFYSARVADMCREIFSSFDDLLRNINHHLMKAVKNFCHTKLEESKWDEIFSMFFSCVMKNFCHNFDEGENFCRKLLMFNHDKSVWEYIQERKKKNSLKPMLQNELKSEELVLSPIKNFEFTKNKFAQNLKEALMLKIELTLERKIYKYNQSFEKVKEKYAFIDDQIKNKPDMTYIGKNIDLMSNKLKMIKREFNGLV
jgi:hypothetical protein